MRKPPFSLTLVVVALMSACSGGEVKTVPASETDTGVAQHAGQPHAASTQPKDGDYPGTGKVTKINTELGSVELDHREIVGVMPAMQMEFYVKDKSLLDGIKVGDNVEFVLEYKHPSETIVGIKKIQ